MASEGDSWVKDLSRRWNALPLSRRRRAAVAGVVPFFILPRIFGAAGMERLPGYLAAMFVAIPVFMLVTYVALNAGQNAPTCGPSRRGRKARISR